LLDLVPARGTRREVVTNLPEHSGRGLVVQRGDEGFF
jgi:hypothetical protein